MELILLQVHFFYSKYFKKKDEIILTTLEHNSNLLPWVNLANLANLKIKLAKFNEMGIITPEEIEKLITEKQSSSVFQE